MLKITKNLFVHLTKKTSLCSRRVLNTQKIEGRYANTVKCQKPAEVGAFVEELCLLKACRIFSVDARRDMDKFSTSNKIEEIVGFDSKDIFNV